MDISVAHQPARHREKVGERGEREKNNNMDNTGRPQYVSILQVQTKN